MMFFFGGDIILKSCSKCGRIHDSSYVCKSKVGKENKTKAQRFRSSYAWYKKQQEIRVRDLNMCRVCLLNLFNTKNRFNTNDLSVHHIIPINADYSKRLDNNNLITLCTYHHKLADSNKIKKSLLLEEAKYPPTLEYEKFNF